MSRTINDIVNVVGVKNVLTSSWNKKPFTKGWRYGEGSALAVVKPNNLLQIWKILKICVRDDKIIIMQGANTGLTGGSTPDNSGYDRDIIIINTLKINNITVINDLTENTGYTYNGATGVITFNTVASYSITLTGTWSGAPYDSSAPGPTMGGLRIITNTGMTYMGSTQNDGTNWISTITIVMRVSATDTIVCKAYNPSSSLLTITPNIEILRIGG